MARREDGPAQGSEIIEGAGIPNPDAELEAELLAAERDRFDTEHVFVMTARAVPPVPLEG
jgi:hypothetical protein